jgi:hypothetical protein
MIDLSFHPSTFIRFPEFRIADKRDNLKFYIDDFSGNLMRV